MDNVDLPICNFPGCGKRFTKNSRLKAHKIIHDPTAEKPHKCDWEGCSAAYTTRPHLNRHKIKTHSRPQGAFKCQVGGCTATFDSEFHLRQHANRTHFKEVRKLRGPVDVFPCEICKREFTKQYRLQEHSACHSNEKGFNCDKCGEAFDLYAQFKRHVDAHKKTLEMEKKVECEKCGQHFETYKGMLIHKRLKHPISHICKECGQSFAQKSSFRAHISTHAEIRDTYRCPVADCTKIYYFERGLNEHILRIHEGVSHVCPYCGKHLCSKQKLNYHMKLHDLIPKVHPTPKPVKRKSRVREFLIRSFKNPVDLQTLFTTKKTGRKKKEPTETQTEKVDVEKVLNSEKSCVNDSLELYSINEKANNIMPLKESV